MTSRLIVPIVEGQGEQLALPILIRRIFGQFQPDTAPVINPPIRVKATSFCHDAGYFKKIVELATSKAAQGDGMVLILLDCEDECPGTLGTHLVAKALAVRSDIPCTVVLARREYETWFLAAATSLAGCAGLPVPLDPPQQPEAIRGAKEWLGRNLPSRYDPIIHQAKFTATFNLVEAQTVPSFARMVAKLIA